MSVPPTPQIPFVPHHKAFKHFSESFSGKPEGELKALIAIGLYSQSECLWAEHCSPTPGVKQVAQYHQIATAPHSLKDIEDEVEIILKNFSDSLVDLYQKQQFSSIIKNVGEELRKSPKEFRYGVYQAITGAFFYTLILLAISIVANVCGIDIIEVFKRVSGHD